MCKLVKLGEMKSSLSTSLIRLKHCVSRDHYSHEILISKLPKKPYGLSDLKTAYITMKKVKCCIDINTVRIVKSDRFDDDLFIDYVEDHTVEITVSGCNRKVRLLHHAVELSDSNPIHTILPFCCYGCEVNRCMNCNDVQQCHFCNSPFCNICNRVKICIECKLPQCNACSVPVTACEKCKGMICARCSYGIKTVFDLDHFKCLDCMYNSDDDDDDDDDDVDD